jgi:hypothetical protein
VAVGRVKGLLPAAFATTPVSQVRPWLRLLSPLVEPDVQISRIRLSCRTSGLRVLPFEAALGH